MANHDHAAAAIMYDKAKSIKALIVGNQAVGALKWIVVSVAIHLQRRLHRLATQ